MGRDWDPARKRPRGRALLESALLILMLTGPAAATPAPAPDERAGRLERAQASVLRYFATSVETADPSWLSLFGYMHRRFGVDARLASGAAAHTLRGDIARPEVYAIYRRLDDPDAQVDKAAIAALPTAIDRITASALHCDRIPLPEDWVAILAKASRAGAYALTHAVLATEWTVENGCRGRQDVTALHAEQVRLLEQLIEQRDTLANQYESATDLWVEAMAMLDYSRAGDRIRAAWIDDLLSQQRADGGWPRHPRAHGSDPHASALALWMVLEQRQPQAPPIRWIAPSAGDRATP
jgi:hypothetical protein